MARTVIIETSFLEEVDDLEAVRDPWECAPHLEVVPLGVSLSVEVCLQHQLVFKFASVQNNHALVN